jgi:hypothetical protein
MFEQLPFSSSFSIGSNKATAPAATLGPSVAPISRTAACLTVAGATGFLVLLVLLHFLKPELDPSWRFISEYAIGDYGWMMALAFLSLALGYVALFIAIRRQLGTFAGRVGMTLLLVSAIGLILAGVFTSDPITATESTGTMHGKLHSLGGMLGLAMPFAAALISWSLARSKAWSSARRSLRVAGAVAVVGFLVSFVSLSAMMAQTDGQFGPDVWVGWPNRLEVLGYSGWLITVAGRAIGLASSRPEAGSP